jgi:hypothetical protein
VGTVSPKQKELVLSGIDCSTVEFIPYVDHSLAIKYMLDSNALLLIIPDHQSNKSIITGKLFEYIASGNPIICLGPPDGDAAQIIEISHSGVTINYFDTVSIEKNISLLAERQYHSDKNLISGFSRKFLTQRVAGIL